MGPLPVLLMSQGLSFGFTSGPGRFLLMQMECREGEDAGCDAKNLETFGSDAQGPAAGTSIISFRLGTWTCASRMRPAAPVEVCFAGGKAQPSLES